MVNNKIVITIGYLYLEIPYNDNNSRQDKGKIPVAHRIPKDIDVNSKRIKFAVK